MELPDEVKLVTDAEKVGSYNALHLPALVIDGKTVTEDSEYGIEELVRIIEKA